MSRLQLVASGLLMLLGVAHVGITFVQYESPSLDALWFLGSGLFVLTVGALNLGAAKSDRTVSPKGLWTITLLANGVGALLAAGFMWLTRLNEPQGLLLLLAFIACGVGALRAS